MNEEKPGAESSGKGWLLASCMAWALAALLAWQLKAFKTNGLFASATFTVVLFGVPIAAFAGGVFGMLGASMAASAGNKRFVVIVPAIANVVFLLWFVAAMLAP